MRTNGLSSRQFAFPAAGCKRPPKVAPETTGDACVSDETSFFALYEELGLDAGCSLEDFKHAYRRRAAQLHPDRGGSGADVQRLQRLNVLYDNALAFQQTHGRLPGGRMRAPMANPAAATPDYQPASGIGEVAPASGRGRGLRLAGLLLLTLLLYWLGLGMKEGGAPSLDPAGPGDHVAPGLLQPQMPDLALGMDKALARKVLGPADNESASRWDYGPSWVEFQCGQVTGWYSSPMRPLRVANDTARAQAPRC